MMKTNTNTITYKRDSEGDYDIVINGELWGSVGRGWLRLGGNQWVLNGNHARARNFGFQTLAEAKHWVEKNS